MMIRTRNASGVHSDSSSALYLLHRRHGKATKFDLFVDKSLQ